jgi:hypothetical protein
MPRYRCIATRPVDLDGGALLPPRTIGVAPSSARHDALVAAGHLQVLPDIVAIAPAPPRAEPTVAPMRAFAATIPDITPELAPAGENEE